jgi:chromosome segregation ATPase
LFALTAAGLLIAAGRVLLSSHEEHRMAGAVLAAEESRRLTVELGLCKDQLSKSLVDAQAATEKLDQHSDAVFIHSARVDAQVISIEQQKEPLSIAIATVSKETSLLVEQEQLVRTKIEGMSADLSACSATIIKATDEVSEAYTELMAVIEVTRQSQAANQNRFFAAGGSLTNTLTSTSYFEQVDAENDETEAFLKSIGAWRPMTTI